MVRRKVNPVNPDELSVIDAALYWAAQGWAVFPAKEKRPLTKNGFKDAVSDPAEVRKLFEFYGSAAEQVGASMGEASGVWAIDLDLYKGKEVDDWMQSLIEKEMLPETRIHKTPRGGIHLFYNGDTMPKSSYPLDGVEVRGSGSYIIAPGGGAGYAVVSENIVSAPKNLLSFLASIKTAQSQDTVSGLKANILAAENFHDSIARLAARYAAMGWDQEKVTASIMDTMRSSMASDERHPRHDRWVFLMENQQGEFMRAVTTAHRKYNTNAATQEFVDSVEPDAIAQMQAAAAVAFKDIPHDRDKEDVTREYVDDEWPDEGQAYFAHEEYDVLDHRYIIYPVLSEDESVLIAGEPKTGKTAIALTLGLHLATGRPLGPSLGISEPRGVVYYGLEGRRAIRLRVAAWKRHYRGLGETIPDRIPLRVVEGSKNLLPEASRIQLVRDIERYEQQFQKHFGVSLGLITFDTFTKAMPGGDQNSVEDTSLVFDVVNRLRATGCRAAVCFLHHKARAGNIRGSTNIEADPDTITSIYKEGANVVWSVDRARSTPEGVSFRFQFSSYFLGNNIQGHPENAPVVSCVDSEVATGLAEGMSENKVAAIIVAMGKGVHPLAVIIPILAAQDCAPMTLPIRRGGKPRVAAWSSKIAQEFFERLIPNKGWAFAGVTLERVVQDSKMTAVHIY